MSQHRSFALQVREVVQGQGVAQEQQGVVQEPEVGTSVQEQAQPPHEYEAVKDGYKALHLRLRSKPTKGGW